MQNAPAGVTITQAVVSREGVLYPVTLPELLAGFVFTQAGEYAMVITYNYLGNPAETIVQYFTVLGEAHFPYIQVERSFGGVIPAGTPIVFDNILQSNGSIDCDTVNGQFMFYFCGIYFVRWFAAPQLGLTADGANFAAVVDNTQGPQGSGHAKVAATAGFAILEIDSVPYTAQLLNTSGGEIALSDFARATVGLVIAKIADIGTNEEGE